MDSAVTASRKHVMLLQAEGRGEGRWDSAHGAAGVNDKQVPCSESLAYFRRRAGEVQHTQMTWHCIAHQSLPNILTVAANKTAILADSEVTITVLAALQERCLQQTIIGPR